VEVVVVERVRGMQRRDRRVCVCVCVCGWVGGGRGDRCRGIFTFFRPKYLSAHP
jgi:hypothetical protein